MDDQGRLTQVGKKKSHTCILEMGVGGSNGLHNATPKIPSPKTKNLLVAPYLEKEPL